MKMTETEKHQYRKSERKRDKERMTPRYLLSERKELKVVKVSWTCDKQTDRHRKRETCSDNFFCGFPNEVKRQGHGLLTYSPTDRQSKLNIPVG